MNIIVRLKYVFCVVFSVILLLSLTNTYVFQFLDSPVFDAIECTETDGESETEKEQIDDEYVRFILSSRHYSLDTSTLFEDMSINHDNAHMDIFTPPPEFI